MAKLVLGRKVTNHYVHMNCIMNIKTTPSYKCESSKTHGTTQLLKRKNMPCKPYSVITYNRTRYIST